MSDHLSMPRGAARPVLLSVVLLSIAACSGGSGGPSSPTAPSVAATSVLSTQWGDLQVEANGYAFDLDRARSSIAAGYERGRRQMGGEIDQVWLSGYHVTVMPPDWELAGQHLRENREIRVRAGVENVLEHEVQHLFAWELGRFSDCRTYQDHAGGYDLHCGRLP